MGGPPLKWSSTQTGKLSLLIQLISILKIVGIFLFSFYTVNNRIISVFLNKMLWSRYVD